MLRSYTFGIDHTAEAFGIVSDVDNQGKEFAWIKKKNKKYKKLPNKGSLWARGYFVSTVGVDEEVIRRYVRHHSKHNQIQLDMNKPT